MNHQITEIKKLLYKYHSNTATREEVEQLFNLMARHDNSEQVKQLLQQELADTETQEVNNKRWNDLFERIEEEITGLETTQHSFLGVLRWWGAAASVLIFIAASFFFFNQRQNKLQLTVQKKTQFDIKPGERKATLILASGEEITLTDGLKDTISKSENLSVVIDDQHAIHYQAGKVVPVGENKLVTGKGEQSPYYLLLPDGTKAWLNAASSITFPTAFTGKNRVVKITGEVYFEVVHNARQPFQVKAAGQTVEDIGTSFNINAYADEPEVSTTLLEGSAKVINVTQSVVLKPGQQALSNTGSSISVKQADVAAIMAWQKGLFKFKDADLRLVMRQLARWYNVEVRYEGNIPNRKFSGEVTRNLKLSQMLEVLSYYQVHFEVKKEKDNSVIIVKP
ncbi:FecR domain-containing protein [Mucilaginibacter sp. PAMB04274]|uniref:FecR family protein n=1 Tax=Mucilaginibacter sp. PAMB04274 TaxID=3138568 RepID=UPI0031F5FDA9